MSRRVPFATLLLLGANLVAAGFYLGDADAAWKNGFVPAPLVSPTILLRLTSALTAQFTHIEPLHLLGNMLLLAALGPLVESSIGGVRFLILYVFTGLVGFGAHWAMATWATTSLAGEPVIGASASIAGVIGYAWVRFYRRRVPLLPRVAVPAYVVVAVWAGLQVAGAAFSASRFGTATAYWTHLGGLLAGLLLALIFRAPQGAKDEASERRMAEAAGRTADSLASAARERLADRPRDPKGLKTLAESRLAVGDTDGAVAALGELLRTSPEHEGGYAALELCRLKAASVTTTEERIAAARALSARNPEAAERLLMTLLEEAPGESIAEALGMLVDIAAKDDPAGAQHYLKQLERDYPESRALADTRRRHPRILL
ncbi:MAG: rhomboid family intramembrane serine protease [Armatimonadetes bacterium]|nr:rhomboid family intramembrane serine protease [Armatimonadota bacterium]NOG93706.1 rhomboid family intramembrane serine protease [Armatimonadota bacterium]